MSKYYEVVINLRAGASMRCGHHHPTPDGAEKCFGETIKWLSNNNKKDWTDAYIVDDTGEIYLPPPVPLSPLVRRAAEAVAAGDGKHRDVESEFRSARERTGYGHYPLELCKSAEEFREQNMARAYEEDRKYAWGGGGKKFLKD